MIDELTCGIEDTGIRAGFIKLACGESSLDASQQRIFRAGATASLRTGAVIAVHLSSGERATEVADFLELNGLPLDRLIWVHAQSEPDMSFLLTLANRGVYIEYDSIGDHAASNQELMDKMQVLREAGYLDRILLSQDAGWYQPGRPGGGQPMPYTNLTDVFLPAFREAGHHDCDVKWLTVENPFRAFAMG